jgi:putative toxin-antitoxin system antitoxin component (TIGR02293 family)
MSNIHFMTLGHQQKLNKEIVSVLNQSAVPYYSKDMLRKLTFDEFLSEKMLLISMIRIGVPYSLFELIRDFSPFTDEDWTEILNISTKTLQRYSQDTKHSFKPIQSEKIIEIAEVSRLGQDVFGDNDRFKSWLNTPSYALGNQLPIELLKDSYGKELVMNELTRINYGILS